MQYIHTPNMLKMQANRKKKVTATIRPEEHWVSQKVDQGNSYDHAAVELKAEGVGYTWILPISGPAVFSQELLARLLESKIGA